MPIKTILKSKLATAGLSLTLLMILGVSAKLLLQKYEVEKEIADLQQKAAEISSDNVRLSELIKYYKTDEYAERASRDKLNLKKEGEFAVSIPASIEAEVLGTSQPPKTNPQKWYDYFF